MRRAKILLFLIFNILHSLHSFADDNHSPYYFIENKGQLPAQVLFAAGIPGGKLFLAKKSLFYVFYDDGAVSKKHLEAAKRPHNNSASRVISPADEQDSVKMHSLQLVINNISSGASLKSEKGIPQYFNYFTGSNCASNVHAYESVTYFDIYSGIDLKLHSLPDKLKYDINLKPHADAAAISLSYKGATSINIIDGNLQIKTSVNTVIEQKPVAYQINGKDTLFVECKFNLNGDQVSFSFPKGYNRKKELIIDPILIFSTYSGSLADNWGFTATYGENGTLYFGGNVFNVGFQFTPGAFQTSYSGNIDVALMKMDSAGNNILWASYLGGNSAESPHSLVVNKKNELLIMGSTSSTNFPHSKGAYDTAHNGGTSLILDNAINYQNGADIFISKLSMDGSSLISSTFLGGAGNDGIMTINNTLYWFYGDSFRGDIYTDKNDDVYIASYTNSLNFPTKSSFQPFFGGGNTDGVVVKMKGDLTDIIWSSYLGGNLADGAYTLKLDDSLNVYIGGATLSSNLHTPSGGLNPSLLGDSDGFIVKIKSDGSLILKSTFLGTDNYDQVYLIDLDKDKNVYAVGSTYGPYPVTDNVFSNTNGGQFLHELNNNLSTTVFSTVFGKNSSSPEPDIRPTAFLVSDCENIYITGWGNTSGLPISSDAFQTQTDNEDFYFLVLSKKAEKILYGTFFGGKSPRGYDHVDGGTSRFDKKGIVYHAVCGGCLLNWPRNSKPSFPITSNAPYKTVYSDNCNMAAFKFDLSTVNSAFDIVEKTGCNAPFTIAINNTSSGGVNYLWDFGDGTSSTDYDITSHVYNKPGEYKITLQASNAENCGNKTDISSQTINVYTTNFSIGPGDKICSGENYELMASGGVTYKWTPTAGLSNSNISNPVANPSITTLYKVIITDDHSCQHSDSVLLEVIESVETDFGNTFSFECKNTPRFAFINKSKYAKNYFWDFGDGTTSTVTNPVHEFIKDSIYQVKLTASNELCTSTKTIPLPVVKTFVPNVFTPNGDYKNDFFEIRSQEPIQLLVYNRWGREVYRSEEYKNDWNAAGLPTAMYFYTITDRKNNQCKGWVQVLR